MELFAIQEVKDLHHDEGVKNESEMSRKNPELFVHCLVVFTSIDSLKSATSNRATNNTISPFMLWVRSKYCFIVRVHKFGNEFLSRKNQYHNHNKLEHSLAKNVFEHSP